MRYWVGVTDRDWFETLRRLQPDEVNFWQPSQRAPRRMDAGWAFLFKLHSPRNFVVGGGFFVRFTELPCFLNEEFKNGRVYYDLDGRSLAYVPDRLTDQPGPEFLEWHNSEVYLG